MAEVDGLIEPEALKVDLACFHVLRTGQPRVPTQHIAMDCQAKRDSTKEKRITTVVEHCIRGEKIPNIDRYERFVPNPHQRPFLRVLCHGRLGDGALVDADLVPDERRPNHGGAEPCEHRTAEHSDVKAVVVEMVPAPM